jgi:hypothetical protein
MLWDDIQDVCTFWIFLKVQQTQIILFSAQVYVRFSKYLDEDAIFEASMSSDILLRKALKETNISSDITKTRDFLRAF